MKHRLTLDYSLGEGELAPYLDGLREGQARALRCRTSSRVTFPPEHVYGSAANESAGSHEWVTLTGTAEVIHRTDGPEGTFALVRFAGANNQAVGRIANPALKGDRAQLVAVNGDMPGLVLEILGEAVETAE